MERKGKPRVDEASNRGVRSRQKRTCDDVLRSQVTLISQRLRGEAIDQREPDLRSGTASVTKVKGKHSQPFRNGRGATVELARARRDGWSRTAEGNKERGKTRVFLSIWEPKGHVFITESLILAQDERWRRA
jgi:hypothetical protein